MVEIDERYIIAGLTTGTQTTSTGKAMVPFPFSIQSIFLQDRPDIGRRHLHRTSITGQCIGNCLQPSPLVYQVTCYGRLLFLTVLITYLLPFFLNPLKLNWSNKVGYILGAAHFLTALYRYYF